MKVCCGDDGNKHNVSNNNEESNQEVMQCRVSGIINQRDNNKENNQEAIPHWVTPSIGCNCKSISEMWWGDLRAKNSSMKD
jgi:hypothetical protein